MNTVFHLIRHAAHDQLGIALTGRSAGGELSDQGRAQARALAAALAQEPLDAIRASPRERTRETAEIIAEGRGIAPEASDDLDEIDFGRWSGMSFQALAGDPDWRRWNDERATARTPGGEKMRDAADRIGQSIGRLRAQFPGGSVWLVTHCDVIKAAVCDCLGLSFDRMHRFEIDPASVTTLVAGDWGAKLLSLNRTADAGAGGGTA